jgi:hypothetical protein
MAAPAAFPHSVRRAPWALWTALLAMLLALQVSMGAIRPATLAEAGAVAAELTLPAPLAAQFRDTGHALKAAGQRINTLKSHDNHDDGPPSLPPHDLAFASPLAVGDVRHVYDAGARRGDAPANAYRARAPPLLA